MPTPDELIALFGDDFDDVLKGLNALPLEVRQLLDDTMGKMIYDSEVFAQRVNKTIQTQGARGIAFSNTAGMLATDMAERGRVFGELRNGIKESLVEGINQSGQAGSFQAYDPEEKTIFTWVTVAGHKICHDCSPRGGQRATLKEWEEQGMPATGWSVCGGYCYCILDPSVKISPRVEFEKVQEKGATIKPKKDMQYYKKLYEQEKAKKIGAPIISSKTQMQTKVKLPSVKGQKAPTKIIEKAPTGKTTFKNYDKGSKEIEKYFINQEIKNASNVQIMQGYSSNDYLYMNRVGRYWDNEIRLGNDMLFKHKQIINKTMNKAGDVMHLKGYEDWKNKFTQLKEFLTKTPNYEGMTYRGLSLKESEYLKFITRFEKNKIVESNTFWSSSASEKIAKGFSAGGYQKVLLKMKGKTGTILDGHTLHKLELEVLFNAKTKFRVASTEHVGEILEIVLEEIV